MQKYASCLVMLAILVTAALCPIVAGAREFYGLLSDGTAWYELNLWWLELPSGSHNHIQYFNDDIDSVVVIPDSISINGRMCPVTKFTGLGTENQTQYDTSESVAKLLNEHYPEKYFTVILPNTVKQIGAYSFAGKCFKKIVLPEHLVEIGKEAFYDMGDAIINMPASVRSIEDGAFQKNGYFRNLTFEEPISIGDYAFEQSALQSVVIKSADSRIGRAFSSCDDLESVDIAGERIVRAFSYCKNLKTVRTSASWMDQVFMECPLLSELELAEGVKQIFNSSFNKAPLPSVIELPTTIKIVSNTAFSRFKTLNFALAEGTKSASNYLFIGNTRLEHVTLPSSIDSIKKGTFSGCSNLREIELPPRLKSIGAEAFKGCSLKEIGFPFGLTEIGESAFEGLSDIKRLDFPATTTQIGDRAFYNCTGIDTVIVRSKESFGIEENTFSLTTYDKALLIVPTGTKGDYSRRMGWRNFFNIIEADLDLPQGDVNGDGHVDVSDVNTLINIILGRDDADNYNGRASVMDNEKVDVSDVSAAINIMLGL